MKVWIFENSYYIGNDEYITAKAIRSEEIEVPEGKKIVVENGKLSLIEDNENLM